ncbi:citrate lyase [Devosia limi DSM 17137]|uniref:Citrate lyase n=1 Tax=Devosia limi DSM 17137 TaxID=1121477 RepID=A0A0F5LRU1_9HYPH|nr:CoA ester lyase [Devosia limi]KKB85075.1 citrate lyase [Devosia limi DSM 17137]SHF39438.1 citrate lyase subunit beta / citryl-CoA lyase [Devosia limi DSM 17137]
MIIRSLLYVPGSNPRFIEKAHARGADAIIIDLEDAVAPSMKTPAREALAESVSMAGRSGAPVLVRINATDDRRFADAEAACRAGAFGIYIPKVDSAAVLVAMADFLAPIEAELGREPMVFVPLIESPLGVLGALDIARGPRVFALSGGGEDLATAMGGLPLPQVLSLPKQMIHLAARAAGVRSFGLLRTVADYNDLDGMRAAAIEARQFGFDGASCIHPSIVATLNTAFSPSEADIAWASKVVAADEQAASGGIGAHTVDGKFVDAPIVSRARALLALASTLEHNNG